MTDHEAFDRAHVCAGAYLCIFAEDVVRNFLRGREVATVYEAGSGPAPEEVEKKRQEIGKLVCRLVDERQRGDGGGSDAAARS